MSIYHKGIPVQCWFENWKFTITIMFCNKCIIQLIRGTYILQQTLYKYYTLQFVLLTYYYSYFIRIHDVYIFFNNYILYNLTIKKIHFYKMKSLFLNIFGYLMYKFIYIYIYFQYIMFCAQFANMHFFHICTQLGQKCNKH